MHFEFLVEGQTELTALSILMEKIVGAYGQPHTWKIHKHRGIGRLPGDPKARSNKNDQTLLHNLPSKLRAYGNEGREDLVVVVLVDLDDRQDCRVFKDSLSSLLSYCPKKPNTIFRIAIEELEAWFLADADAVLAAYPEARKEILDGYLQDSQCGTWEKLAEAVYPGGVAALGKYGKRSVRILEQKRIWASKICPLIDVEVNRSQSFVVFRDGIRQFTKKVERHVTAD